MGLRFSKISYKMSEAEQKLGYVQNESEKEADVCQVGPEVSIEAGYSLSKPTGETSGSQAIGPGPGGSAANQYHSNSSLSSGNGDISCVHLSWPKAAAEKIGRRRKAKSASKGEQPLDKGSLKKLKRSCLKGIGSSKKKDEGSLPVCTESSLPNAAVPSTSVACVCTAYRRTNSGPQEPRLLVPGCNISVALEPMSLEHRLSAPHVLGVFNPEDYPIEDEDEKMRRQRAKEMSEGVELSEKFGMLSFNKGSYQPAAHSQIDYIHVLVPDLKEITCCSFYWGKIDRYAAEKLLEDKPEGTFLLRDSAQEEYLFSVSFRRYGRSLHARIEQWGHAFSFDAHDPSVYSAPTVTGLIEHYKDPSYCMFFEPMLTVRLHRNFTFSLQHLARSVICNSNTYDSISSLPLPKTLKEYCREYHYKQRVRVRNFPE